MTAEIITPPLRPSWQDWIAKAFGPAPAVSCAGAIAEDLIRDRIAQGGPYAVTRCVFIVRGRAWCFVLNGEIDLVAAYNAGADVTVQAPPPAVQKRLATMTGSQREASLINDAPLPWRYLATGAPVTELARTIK